MRRTVVVDNMSVNMKLLAEWGHSSLLETPVGNVLFDVGMRGETLTRNLRALKAPSDVAAIALSHGHDDHCGGLEEALRLFPDAQVCASARVFVERRVGRTPERAWRNGGVSFPIPGLKPLADGDEILPGVVAVLPPAEARDPAWIHGEGLWEVGPDGTPRPDSFSDDLSLLADGDHGPSLLLGCAHAGLPNILRWTRERFGVKRLHAVTGGMHLSSVPDADFPAWTDALRCVEVDLWRPCHCAGFRAAARLAAVFPDVDWAGAGSRLEL